ncbi:MAG: cysteine desulfurase family protein [Pseudomonadota bacterium]
MFGWPKVAPVYCDYAATTPVDGEVAAAMHESLIAHEAFANPSSTTHYFGRAASEAVEAATETVAGALGVQSEEIIWTSGATEADNLAILGAARYAGKGRGHIVSSKIEHKAVLDPVKELERAGFEVTWLAPDPEGRIGADQLRAALRDDTRLVSLMWVNNELGTINDVAGYAESLSGHEAIFHVDAAQAFGKIPVRGLPSRVDMASFTGHKFYGPKGVGVLYLGARSGVNISPLLFGGGQQRGLRPGTLATHQIVGFAKAAELAMDRLERDYDRLTGLGERLVEGLLSTDGVTINGHRDERLPWLVNVRVNGVHGDALMRGISPVAVSAGSACNSRDRSPSFVLKALGLSDLEAAASLRLSLGRATSEEDVDSIIRHFKDVVKRCRALAGALSP